MNENYDYYGLLKKYMKHIEDEEGTNFVWQARLNDDISLEEHNELMRMSDEVNSECIDI